MKKSRRQSRQSDRLRIARFYARRKEKSLCRRYIRLAWQMRRLSDLQWFNIEVLTTPTFVEKLRSELEGGKS